MESDKFARERSSTEKLRCILRSESGQDMRSSGLASVSLLLMDSNSRQLAADPTVEGQGETVPNKVKHKHCTQ